MSSWYEERPSQEFRKRVEHRAFQMIDNLQVQENDDVAHSLRKRWTSLFQIATGLSVAALAAVFFTRRSNDPTGVVVEFDTDSLALDFLEETRAKQQEQMEQSKSLDLDLLADLELLESFDDLNEISEDEMAEENV